MSQELWNAVDQYFTDQLIPDDSAFEAVSHASARAGLPNISVSASHGKLLHLLARMRQARAILEIGTLGGYSTIWLGRALPADGTLVTLEVDPEHARIARTNVDRTEISDLVDIRVGPALETLPLLTGPFDLFFIDADKPNNPEYFRWALELGRPGSVIVVDNVVRGGAVTDPDRADPAIRGTREMTELIAADPRVEATALQTVGAKGYDGLILAFVLDPGS